MLSPEFQNLSPTETFIVFEEFVMNIKPSDMTYICGKYVYIFINFKQKESESESQSVMFCSLQPYGL